MYFEGFWVAEHTIFSGVFQYPLRIDVFWRWHDRTPSTLLKRVSISSTDRCILKAYKRYQESNHRKCFNILYGSMYFEGLYIPANAASIACFNILYGSMYFEGLFTKHDWIVARDVSISSTDRCILKEGALVHATDLYARFNILYGSMYFEGPRGKRIRRDHPHVSISSTDRCILKGSHLHSDDGGTQCFNILYGSMYFEGRLPILARGRPSCFNILSGSMYFEG